MDIKISQRLSGLAGYPFAEIDKKVSSLKAAGVDVIDFGVGDPAEPTPEIVRVAIKRGVDVHASGGYPSYIGSLDFRNAISSWTKKRFGVDLDPAEEICASIGSKEAVFNFPKAFLNAGDCVLAPNPGYPPYSRGTMFAGGETYYLNLKPENNFLPNLSAIPAAILKKAKILWINYPNNPTGATAPISFFKRAVEFGHRHNIIIASDEAYSENYYENDAPSSALQVSKDGVVVFNSLSKRSCMTGYRVGWIAGDKKIVTAFKKLKTNIDSGTPTFIQDAAIAALSDETHVENLRELYKKKRDIMVSAFTAKGLKECRPSATLYIWQFVPKDMTSAEFAEKLLDPKIAIVVTPGNFISEKTKEGNPGEGFVRLALVPTIGECEKAAERIKKHFGGIF